jgi:hypothetical protein
MKFKSQVVWGEYFRKFNELSKPNQEVVFRGEHEMRDPLKLGHRLVLGKPLNSISCQEYVMGICQV